MLLVAVDTGARLTQVLWVGPCEQITRLANCEAQNGYE